MLCGGTVNSWGGLTPRGSWRIWSDLLCPPAWLEGHQTHQAWPLAPLRSLPSRLTTVGLLFPGARPKL